MSILSIVRHTLARLDNHLVFFAFIQFVSSLIGSWLHFFFYFFKARNTNSLCASRLPAPAPCTGNCFYTENKADASGEHKICRKKDARRFVTHLTNLLFRLAGIFYQYSPNHPRVCSILLNWGCGGLEPT